MNVYDFDGTIYDGECTLDFYFYCVKHHFVLVRFVFIVLFTLIKYKMCLVSEDELMRLCNKYVYSFLKDCPDAKQLAKEFWKTHKKKIKPFYKTLHKDDDIIISASFGFYLKEIMEEIGVKKVLCSEVDLETGEIKRLCYRRNKKELFECTFSGAEIQNFYTDSMNDLPLMKMAKKGAYMVRGNKIEQYNFDEGR